MASPHELPRSRKAAQEQANLIFSQVRLGWPEGHDIIHTAAVLLAKIEASNLTYRPDGE